MVAKVKDDLTAKYPGWYILNDDQLESLESNDSMADAGHIWRLRHVHREIVKHIEEIRSA